MRCDQREEKGERFSPEEELKKEKSRNVRQNVAKCRRTRTETPKVEIAIVIHL